MQPTVYVITVVYNGEKTIETTIRSVIDQTYGNLKYIVIDGGSSDNTVEIIKRYSDKIVQFISEKDNGVYDAMNKAIKYINEEDAYLLFLNSDDYFASDKSVESVMEQMNHEDFIYSKINYCSDKEQIILGSEVMTMKELIFKKMCYHQATFYKRSIFDKIGLYDIKYKIAADYEFSLRAFSNAELEKKYIDQVVSVVNAGGLSNQYKLSVKEKTNIIKKYFSFGTFALAWIYNYFYIIPICFTKQVLNPKLYKKRFHQN